MQISNSTLSSIDVQGCLQTKLPDDHPKDLQDLRAEATYCMIHGDLDHHDDAGLASHQTTMHVHDSHKRNTGQLGRRGTENMLSSCQGLLMSTPTLETRAAYSCQKEPLCLPLRNAQMYLADLLTRTFISDLAQFRANRTVVGVWKTFVGVDRGSNPDCQRKIARTPSATA